MKTKTTTYKGLLSIHDRADDSVLYLSSLSNPLVDELYWIKNKQVTVRYWISDKEITKDEAITEFVTRLMGKAECDFGACYSELTGYLWTDEKLKVGGHNLVKELYNNVGKWLILEIETK